MSIHFLKFFIKFEKYQEIHINKQKIIYIKYGYYTKYAITISFNLNFSY